MLTSNIDPQDFELQQQREQDEKLLVKFYVKSVRNSSKSAEAGRAIYEDKDYIDIRIPGSRDGVSRPATARDRERFPRHYSAFKQRTNLPEEGTPLAEWPLMTRSQAEELAFFNVKTVEQLADINDNIASSFMGAQMFKSKAKEWLKRAKEEVTIDQLQGELAARDRMLEELEKRLQELETRDGNDN